MAPRKAFLEVAACFAGVDLMNGNVGIIVFTRGTHGGLSRSLATLGVETFIHKAFRAFLSPPLSLLPSPVRASHPMFSSPLLSSPLLCSPHSLSLSLSLSLSPSSSLCGPLHATLPPPLSPSTRGYTTLCRV